MENVVKEGKEKNILYNSVIRIASVLEKIYGKL